MEIFFSGNLEHLLYRHRMKAAELAKRLKISRGAVSSWVVGRTYPRMEVMIELVQVFNIGLDPLMFSNLKDPAYKDRDPMVSIAAEPSQEYARLKKEYEDLSRRLATIEEHQGIDPRHGKDTKGGKE